MTRDRWLALIGLSIGGILSVPIAAMYWDREPPVTRSEVSVEFDHVRAGGDLVVSYSINRLRDCPVTTERTIYDGDGEQYRLDPSNRLSPGPLGPQQYKRVVQVPASAAPGKARYRVVNAYRCNPLHYWFPIRQVVADVSFWIVESSATDR